jgi:hypothetical protein
MYAINQTGDTRPFKIFVSLLDRWEIGGPVTEALVIDALTALQTGMERAEDNDDVRNLVGYFGRILMRFSRL